MTGYSLNDSRYTQAELEAMTVAQIKALAAERGYSVTKTVKAEIIAEFLTQQEGAGHGVS